MALNTLDTKTREVMAAAYAIPDLETAVQQGIPRYGLLVYCLLALLTVCVAAQSSTMRSTLTRRGSGCH